MCQVRVSFLGPLVEALYPALELSLPGPVCQDGSMWNKKVGPADSIPIAGLQQEPRNLLYY
jgi:hypothetical protein